MQALQVADLFWSLVWLSNVYPVIFRLEAEDDAAIWNLVGLSEGLLLCVKNILCYCVWKTYMTI